VGLKFEEEVDQHKKGKSKEGYVGAKVLGALFDLRAKHLSQTRKEERKGRVDCRQNRG